MTFIVGEEMPAIEDLEHHGVLGMKWGKHRAQAGGKEIRSARYRLGVKQAKYAAADDKRRSLKKGTAERTKADAHQKTLEKQFNKDPDRVVASRMTRGEKVVSVLLAGPLGLVAIGGTSAVSRRIEKKQEDKAYDKKK